MAPTLATSSPSSSGSGGSSSPPQRSMSPATSGQVTQNEVNAQSWHKLMWVPLVLLVPASVVAVSHIVDVVAERQAHMAAAPPGTYDWEYPKLSDLRITLAGLAVLLTLRCTLCPYVFTPLGNRVLPSLAEKKGKWTEAARADRVQRFSVCLFKLCFFLVMSVYGYLTLRDQTFLPPQLGGKGTVPAAWDGYPYSPVTQAVKTYYLVELSYHAHSLVFHLFTIHRNDFVEMSLHHTCAVLLVLFSYFSNWVRVGSLVLFLHDIADVMAYSVKAVVDTRYTALTLTAYAGLLAAWGYTRLYVFPFYVISASQVPGQNWGFAWFTSYAMIWTLQMLHIYWYILFLIMGYRFAVSGKTVDIQQKAGESDGSYVDYHKVHKKHEEQQERLQQQQQQQTTTQAQQGNGRHVADEAEDEGEEQAAAAVSRPTKRAGSGKKSKRAE